MMDNQIQAKEAIRGYKILKPSYTLVNTSLIQKLGRSHAVVLATLLIYEEFTEINSAKLLEFLLGINITTIRTCLKDLSKLGYIKLLAENSYKKIKIQDLGVQVSRGVDETIKRAKLPSLIPLFFKLEKLLGTAEALILGFIFLYQNKNKRFFYSNESIAKAIRISPSYASELVTKLVNLGFLERKVVKNKKTNQSIRFLSLTSKFREAIAPDPDTSIKDIVLTYDLSEDEKYNDAKLEEEFVNKNSSKVVSEIAKEEKEIVKSPPIQISESIRKETNELTTKKITKKALQEKFISLELFKTLPLFNQQILIAHKVQTEIKPYDLEVSPSYIIKFAGYFNVKNALIASDFANDIELMWKAAWKDKKYIAPLGLDWRIYAPKEDLQKAKDFIRNEIKNAGIPFEEPASSLSL